MSKKMIATSVVIILSVIGFILYIYQSNKASGLQLTETKQIGSLKVVTTTTMITDLLHVLGGDVLEINGLMGAGIDPHGYQATEGDVRRLQEADIIFYNGLHLEGKMDDLFEEMSKQGIRTFAVTDGLNQSMLMEGEDGYDGSHDPHIWFDVALWMQVTGYVRDVLIEQDPTNAEMYKNNASNYLKQLEETQHYVVEMAMNLPQEQRVLVTAHDAFQYFGEAYGFEVLGIEGISTESEAGIADIRELAAFIAERKIKAIFVETSVTTRNIEALQQAVRSRGFEVEIGGEIYSDAMGDLGTEEGTYLGMIRHNINTIVQALE